MGEGATTGNPLSTLVHCQELAAGHPLPVIGQLVKNLRLFLENRPQYHK
jgi:hypothetical protein